MWEPQLLWRVLEFSPHQGQLEILQHINDSIQKTPLAPRFIDASTGRQWGKTTAAEVAIWMGLLAPDDEFGPPAIVLTSDTFEHCRLIWDRVIRHAYGVEMLRSLVERYDREREILTLKSGAKLQMVSADRPQGLTGFTLTGAVVDEAAFVSDEALEMMLPCLAVRQGFLLAFGTAEGQGWHRTWFLKGQDANYPDHWSATYPSTNSPYFPPQEMETQRLLIPRRRWEQLYLAHWQTEEGAVFHNLDACCIDAPEETPPEANRKYVIGADLARTQDYTVFYVGDARTGRVLAERVLHNRDWMGQVEELKGLCEKYNKATAIVDATGVGDVVVSALRERGVDTVAVVMSQPVKDRIVSRLVLAIEREDIRWPRCYESLMRELRMYETRVLQSGRVQTSAPAGFHDDRVMALCLLNEGFARGYGGVERSTEEQLWTDFPKR